MVGRASVRTCWRGIRASGKRLGRLIRERHIYGASRRKRFKTTVRDFDARPVPDLVDQLSADAPDKVWVADITYLPTSRRHCSSALFSTSSAVASSVGDGNPFADRARPRCSRHGDPPAQTAIGDQPLRSRLHLPVRRVTAPSATKANTRVGQSYAALVAIGG